ncbi:class I SAM-dependent methyltransferase [Streptomyces sp. ET3-23]|uniref:class I SAM-dependent methyltransferase n=1 Tax=Streptomyces sp. ET3-23 TaxID=2885643 RepID=UPI001D11C261|nr:class I SAM-dependent methyltransferase [Streptomyces sp. ET3-23]MCC2276092.1 class I SAM-dependent methyltransferase [Streptomyces sp. ET3-23]
MGLPEDMYAGRGSDTGLAEDYSWLLPPQWMSGEIFLQQHAAVFAGLPSGSSILDAACGVGVEAVALAGKGFKVSASDASPDMVEQCRRRAAETGMNVPTEVACWRDLPRTWRTHFDLVLCTGNSIVHAAGEEEMISGLRGLRGVLAERGKLLVTSRNWEKIHRERQRLAVPSQMQKQGGRQGLGIYLWDIPETWDAPHVAEIVILVFEGDTVVSRRHEVVFQPFRHGELVHRMQQSGLSIVSDSYETDADWYSVVAERADRWVPSLRS